MHTSQKLITIILLYQQTSDKHDDKLHDEWSLKPKSRKICSVREGAVILSPEKTGKI